jgi:hypothetical protein
MFPRYVYPPYAFLKLAVNVFIGGQRSFRRDGKACVEGLQPPLRILGAEHIPASGPALITFNHYYRPGFNAWWMALGLAAVVPVDIHFVMTGELTYPGKWYAPLGMAGSHWLLWRLSKIYGFTTMPPMPPRAKDVAARARSVRRTLEFAHRHPQAVLGLAPEGGDQPGGLLNWPSSGAGRFLLLLAGAGFHIVPVGAYERDGEFCLNFGEAYDLVVPPGLGAAEKDRISAEIVMGGIAAQLPESLRGSFQ